MKTYRNHRCDRRHKTTAAFLRCAFPTAAWVQGAGDYALIAWCNVPTITLYRTPEDTTAPLATINGGACGSRCTKRHEVVYIDRQGNECT